MKLAAAMVGKPDVAQRLCGSLQVDIEKTRRLLGWRMSLYTSPRWPSDGSGCPFLLLPAFGGRPGWGLCALAILSNKAGALAVVFRPALHRHSPDERMLASPAPNPTFPQRGKEPSQQALDLVQNRLVYNNMGWTPPLSLDEGLRRVAAGVRKTACGV
ncbi:MAG: hypothetical protein Q8K05_05640 [Polaromonas sp.]|uniref:hypothetical protein n=1 Tax=Polaromonas sp. TaxID=1869339 RepID=UPI0027315092|nr:hypothetical protein [Polaromonas sp.]MDP2255528.1 hypothetical protein [Polaromonas sp.]